jgi:glutathione S-transferase
MDWSQSHFEPAFIGVFWGYYRTPKKLRNMVEVNRNLIICNMCLDKLNTKLSENRYLTSEKISLANICSGVFIHRLIWVGLDIPLPEYVEEW